MPLRELVEEALRRGEGEEAEFKLRLDKEAARTLCGLANHRGGLLLIGVNDEGKPIGTPKDSLERLNSLLGSIYPRPRVRPGEAKARLCSMHCQAGFEGR